MPTPEVPRKFPGSFSEAIRKYVTAVSPKRTTLTLVTHHSPSLSPRADLIHRLAVEQGFDFCGIAPVEPSPHGEHVRRWLAAGKHGEMGYLAQDLDMRLDPRELVLGARSVIVVAEKYAGNGAWRMADGGCAKADDGRGKAEGCSEDPTSDIRHPTSPFARIAGYAAGRDYHRRMKKKIHAMCDALRVRFHGECFRGCVDTAPILEREQATAAGLGWIGKNTMLISPRPGVGSHLLLGEIVTTLAVQPTPETEAGRVADHCGTCTRCIDACPTRCIDPRGYTLDASRCVSYLTLEHRSEIDPTLHAAMGDWFAGCDVCQEVCPFNDESSPPSRGLQPRIALLDVLGWDEHARRDAFRASALKRIKLDMAKRNALIAAGNLVREHPDHPDAPALRSRIEELADARHPLSASEPELVRRTAARVRAMLGRASPGPAFSPPPL